ncbi:MAG: sulfatase [Armatimonadota bacterium]|jgi:arylsulfatase A-like enzyme
MNVILIITDTFRADHIGAYGNEWIRTPNLDRLAREGVVFTRAYAEGCPTVQARRALWTGCRTFPFTDHEVRPGDLLNLQYGWMPLHDERWCLSEILLTHGLYTGLISDTPNVFKPGWNFTRGFETWDYVRGQAIDAQRTTYHFGDVPRGPCSTFEERRRQAGRGGGRANNVRRNWEEDYCAPRVMREAMRWVEDCGDVEGFFLVVDTFDPHEPWDPPAHYLRYYSDEDLMRAPYELPIVAPRPRDLSREDVRSQRAGYAGEVTMYDRWLGQLFELFDLMGIWDNTLVCFISDHGTHLGEHGRLGKTPPGLQEDVTRVPMIVRHPDGRGAGKRVNALAYNIDLVAMILSALGIDPPRPIDGIDLWPLVDGKRRKIRDCVTSGYNEWIWYRDNQWTYNGTLTAGEDDRLYDARKDSEEEHNLAPERPEVCADIRERIVEEAGPLREPPDIPRDDPVMRQRYPRVF